MLSGTLVRIDTPRHDARDSRNLCQSLQNLRRGHYELGVDAPARLRVAVAFDELAGAI